MEARPGRSLPGGLPQRNAFVHVMRQASTVDTCDEAGVEVGTTSGEIFYSRNSGSWELLQTYLPSLLVLEAYVVS